MLSRRDCRFCQNPVTGGRSIVRFLEHQRTLVARNVRAHERKSFPHVVNSGRVNYTGLQNRSGTRRFLPTGWLTAADYPSLGEEAGVVAIGAHGHNKQPVWAGDGS